MNSLLASRIHFFLGLALVVASGYVDHPGSPGSLYFLGIGAISLIMAIYWKLDVMRLHQLDQPTIQVLGASSPEAQKIVGNIMHETLRRTPSTYSPL